MKNEDAELIEAFLDGDEGAFTELVKRHQKSVHALAWRKVGDFHVAEEITQDVFVKVYHKLSTLKNPSQFAGWLSVMTHRHCIAWHRKNRVPMQSLEAMDPVEVEEHYYTEHLVAERQAAVAVRKREAVKQILRRLPESERTVVTLHYLGEMSCEEVAAYLGISPNTVKSRLHRARKRLEGQVDALREVLKDFQLRATLSVDILRAVARVKPLAPSGGNPFLPWAVSFSAAVLLILLGGFGVQHVFRYQQPYSFAANSAMTVEIVDAPVTLALEAKPALRTQLGSAAAPGRSRGAGAQTDARRATAATADVAPPTLLKPQWHQTSGPAGGFIVTLFVTAEKSLYAAGGSALYKLSPDRTTWQLVNANLPILSSDPAMFTAPMGERDETLYIVCEAAMFASTDGGETWRMVGPRPSGRALALLITDDAFYLALAEGVFLSKDAGESWVPVWTGLGSAEILAAVAIENTVFVGTDRGLYRSERGRWEKMPLASHRTISSIAAVENRVYFSADKQAGEPSSLLFVSTDLGDSWHELTPNLHRRMNPLAVGSVKLVAIGDMVLGLGVGIIGSTDGGNTWTAFGFNREAFIPPLFPAVALDRSTFFLAGLRGVSCSTDGGHTWHELMNGIVQSRVLNLARVNNVLYASTYGGIFQSVDSGERWTKVPIVGLPPHFEGRLGYPRVIAANGTLYVKAHHLTETCLLELVRDSQVLVPVQGVPGFGAECAEYAQRLREDTKTLSKTGQGGSTGVNRIARSHRAGPENARPGAFAVSGSTFYLADARSIFRWSSGESEWHNIRLGSIRELHRDASGGFQLAASNEVVYVGRSDGHLFQSRDRGDTWQDITAALPVFGSITKIVFASSAVYVATSAGVITSSDGENWHLITDAAGVPLVMHNMAIDGSCVYGASDEGIYQLKNGTLTWKQVASDVPEGMTAFVVDSGVPYVGTKGRGVLSFAKREVAARYRQIVLARP